MSPAPTIVSGYHIDTYDEALLAVLPDFLQRGIRANKDPWRSGRDEALQMAMVRYGGHDFEIVYLPDDPAFDLWWMLVAKLTDSSIDKLHACLQKALMPFDPEDQQAEAKRVDIWTDYVRGLERSEVQVKGLDENKLENAMRRLLSFSRGNGNEVGTRDERGNSVKTGKDRTIERQAEVIKALTAENRTLTISLPMAQTMLQAVLEVQKLEDELKGQQACSKSAIEDAAYVLVQPEGASQQTPGSIQTEIESALQQAKDHLVSITAEYRESLLTAMSDPQQAWTTGTGGALLPTLGTGDGEVPPQATASAASFQHQTASSPTPSSLGT